MIRQSLPLLILCGFGGILAGTVLGGMSKTLELTPGLIVLIPAIIGMKGNIDTTLGSRLGSAAHIGLISPKHIWNKETQVNVSASIILSVFMSVLSGALAHVFCTVLGVPSIGALRLIGIALVAGTLAGTILVFSTVGIIVIASKRGYDPDNVTGPALATIGDLITLGCLFFSAFIFTEVLV